MDKETLQHPVYIHKGVLNLRIFLKNTIENEIYFILRYMLLLIVEK